MKGTAAIYARYSSHQQDKGSSIEAQVAMARKEAARRKLAVPGEYVFVDAAQSARSSNRAAFQRMLSLAGEKPPPFAFIICEDTSRFARNRYEAVIHKHELRKHGVELVYTSQNFEDSIEGRLMEHIMEALDQYHSDAIARKTVQHMMENAMRGWRNGSIPPYGLRRVAETTPEGKTKVRWLPDPKEAPAVRHAFEQKARGISQSVISEELLRMGFRRRSGRPLLSSDILYWFRAHPDTYAGRLVWGKYYPHASYPKFRPREDWVIVEDAFPAIIPAELADKVREIYADRDARRYLRTGPERIYVISSLLRCAECGSSVNPIRSGGRAWSYYVCRGYRKEKRCSNRKNFRTDRLEQMILDKVDSRILSEQVAREWLDDLNEFVDEAKALGDAADLKRTLKGLLSQCDCRLANLGEALAAGGGGLGTLVEKLREEEARKRDIMADLRFLKSAEKLQRVRVSETRLRECLEGSRSVLKEADPLQVRDFLLRVVKEIRVDSRGWVRIIYDRGEVVKQLIPQETFNYLKTAGCASRVKGGLPAPSETRTTGVIRFLYKAA